MSPSADDLLVQLLAQVPVAPPMAPAEPVAPSVPPQARTTPPAPPERVPPPLAGAQPLTVPLVYAQPQLVEPRGSWWLVSSLLIPPLLALWLLFQVFPWPVVAETATQPTLEPVVRAVIPTPRGPTATPTALPSPEPAPPRQTPLPAPLPLISPVAAVGDSVMLGSAEPLSKQVPLLYFDAQIDRQVATALEVLRRMKAEGQLRGAVVIHIGNNGFFSNEQFDQMMELLADSRRVVILNVNVPREWETANNQVIAAGVQRYPNVVLIDWKRISRDRDVLFWDDQIHLRPEGASFYADLIFQQLREP